MESEEIKVFTSVLACYTFLEHSYENGVLIYRHNIALDYYHEVILWPNGMIEVRHYLYGRVFYANYNDFRIGDALKMVIPETTIITPAKVYDHNDDLPW